MRPVEVAQAALAELPVELEGCSLTHDADALEIDLLVPELVVAVHDLLDRGHHAAVDEEVEPLE